MKQSIDKYEKKIIHDKECPIQIFENNVQKGTEKSSVFGSHWHEYMELHYVLHGKLEVMLDRETVTAGEGQMVVVNGNVLHSGYCRGSMRALVVIFAIEDLSKSLARENIIFHNVILDDLFVQEIMNDIFKECMNQEKSSQLICKGQILRLLAHMARHYKKTAMTEEDARKYIQKQERISVILSYIEDNYMRPISNLELAQLIHLSENRFNHVFKECMGTSPLKYINKIRLAKAMQFIKSGQFSTTEVAELSGFRDYNYFSRLFRKTYGCSPTSDMKDVAEEL